MRIAHRTAKLSMLSLSIGLACSAAAFAAPPITMDGAYLAYSAERLAAKDPAYAPALERLLQDADALLLKPSESVTYKKVMPPSGDKHDYMSLAPYFWPDPKKPDGLPYIQRDGQFNPSAKNGDTDSVRMQFMCSSIHSLSLAWYFTKDPKYAKKTAEAIRTWFLDPQTRMNANLNYGQAVMGKVDGRGIGLIDTRNLWMVADAALLLEGSNTLSDAEVGELKTWFKDFLRWMMTSSLGKDENKAANNHGMYYDMQVADYALFTGQKDKAKDAVDKALVHRIGAQVEDDGRQPKELARTTPFHYSAFNLDAMTTLARYAEQVGTNIWNDHEDGRGLRKAINYMVPFALKPETWPYPELRRAETELMLPVLLRAERAYGAGSYAQAIAALSTTSFETVETAAMGKTLATATPTTRNALDRLIWPLKK